MGKTAVISSILRKAMNESDITAKELAYESKTPRSTLSDHMNQKATSIDQSLLYDEQLNNNEFTCQIIYSFFGLFKPVDGDVFRNDPSSLDKLQKIESNERKNQKCEVEKILLKQVNYLTLSDREQIRSYIDEYMDEVVVELTLILSLCDVLGIHMREVCSERMPYWQNEGYMRKEVD